MKKFISLMLVIIMLFSFASCTVSHPGDTMSETEESTTEPSDFQESSVNEIKLGVFEASQGEHKVGSKQSVLGVMFANETLPEIVIGEETYNIKLVVSKTGMTADSAVKAAEKLVSEGVSAVIGSFDPSLLMAACGVFEKAGIPVVCPFGCPASVQERFSNIYSFCADDYEQAQMCADYAFNKIMARKALILCALGDESGQSQALYFKEAFDSMGGSSKIITFEEDAQLPKNVSSYGLIYAPTSQYHASGILEGCISSGTGLSVLGGSNWDSGVTLGDCESRSFPVYCYAYCNIKTDSDFYGDFNEWLFDEDDLISMNGGNLIASSASALSYDAYMLIMKAFEKAGSVEKEAMIKAMKKNEYVGETGYISFDSSGRNTVKSSYLKKAYNFSNTWDIA